MGMKRTLTLAAAAIAVMGLAGAASAQQACTTTQYPYPLQNGQVADASQVTQDLNCAPIYGLAHWTGNVGIGTTTPGSSLHVGAGSITVDPTGINYNEGLRLNVAPNGFTTIALGGATGSTAGVTPWSISSEGGGSNFFDIRNNGATRFAILPNGNVGIGTAAPGSALHVGAGAITVDPTGGNYNEGIRLNVAPNGYATIALGGATGSTSGSVPWSILSEAGSSNFFDIRNNGVTRFAILPNGNVGIGTTTPTATLFVNGSTVLTQGYTTTSDARLKRDVHPVTGALGLVERLQGVRYRWRPVSERTVGKNLTLPLDEPQIGFLAQDLEKVLPEAV